MQLTVVADHDGRVVNVDVRGSAVCGDYFVEVSMHAQCLTASQPTPRPAQLDPSDDLATLGAILEAETGIPSSAQHLLFNGQPLRPSEPLGAQGLGDGDLIVLVQTAPAPAHQRPGRSQGPAGPTRAGPMGMEMRPDGSAVDPEGLMRALAGAPEALEHLPSALSAAIRAGDAQAFQSELRALANERKRAQEEEVRFARLAMEDPMNPEVQRRLEEAIRQKNVVENFEAALEYNPEAFGTVTMLCVRVVGWERVDEDAYLERTSRLDKGRTC